MTRLREFFALAFLIGTALSLHAAQDGEARAPIPAERLAEWSPGTHTGVPGGIPDNRNVLIDVTKAPYNADPTGQADAQPAIQKAINEAKPNEVVYLPAGTYRVNKGVGCFGGKSHITIRGAGPEKTIMLGYQPAGSIIGIAPADGGDWWYPQRAKLEIAGSPARGATVLTVGETKVLDGYPNGGIGQICQLALKNDPKLPVVVPANFDYQRKHLTRIVAKTETTVTIEPGLLFDLPAELAPVLRPVGRYSEGVGIEDLAVDGANSPAPHGLIGVGQSYGCWVKNVAVRNGERYLFGMDGSLRCEIRGCFIAGRKTAAGPNGGGLLFTMSGSCLIEDNVISPGTEVDGGCTGNVFAYNFCDDAAIQGNLLCASINTNHGAHNSFNLYEGNLAPRFQCDGYHGSASHDTAFRNWFHGSSAKTDQYWICVTLNRFTRCYSLVGNVLGRKGHEWNYEVGMSGFAYEKHYIYSLGFPNMGNGWCNGKTAQPSLGQFWPDWEKMLAAAPGKGPGPGGFQELDLDVPATTLRKGNYNCKDLGVPASEALDGAALPASLYRKEKPEWFGDLAWPAFGPDTDFEKHKIPAQARFEARQASAGR
ncbi:MAG: hypothetical protein M5U26_30220 [Planctomycetota bacterium]|nr:hypothetical protein [Planctomycetota bacterium]